MAPVYLESLRHLIGRKRIIVSFAAGLFFLYFATPTLSAMIAGIPILLAGETTRTWASGFIKKDKELAQEGPYALTRNPLYLGNFLIGLGFSIMAHNLILLTLFLLIFSLVYTITIKNEEQKLSAIFGDSYTAYKNRVPAFFPRLSLLWSAIRMTDFEWQLVKKHREHHTWLGILGCLVVFILKVTY